MLDCLKMDNLHFFKCMIALILWLNFAYGSVINSTISSSDKLAAAIDVPAPNILMKRLSSEVQQQVNCTTTESEDCEDSNEIPVIWIQVAGISVSFCLFLVCYIQYRLRVRSKQFKSQILM